jgi:hypothetical protein
MVGIAPPVRVSVCGPHRVNTGRRRVVCVCNLSQDGLYAHSFVHTKSEKL